jgi:hypothetical protein
VALPILWWLLTEIAARYEMWATHMKTRAELGEDLGFGLLLLPATGAAIVGSLVVGYLAWRKTGRSRASAA